MSNKPNQIVCTVEQFKAYINAKRIASEATSVLRRAERAAGIDSVKPVDSTPWQIVNERGRVLGYFQPSFKRGYEVAETWTKGTLIEE